MSNFLHQIFYNFNKFDDESKCNELRSFFLTNDNKQRIMESSFLNDNNNNHTKKEEQIIHNKIEKNDTKNIVQNNHSEPEDIYFSKRKNSIFWAIYLSIYGYEQYLAINNKYGNVELEEKQKIMNFLKTGYSKMKEVSKKTSKTLMQEWMSELMSAAKMSLSILQVFSVYYQRPIIIYIESIRAHLKFYESNESSSSENTPILIIQNSVGHYGVNNNVTSEKIKEIMSGICLEDIEKPLKGISAYKVSDLLELAEKCNISEYENGEKMKKPELYEKIWKYLKIANK